MKAKTLYQIFFIVLCAIGLFGCPVPTPDPAPKPHVPAPSQIVVSGSIDIDGGRSAVVDINKLDLKWYVIATQNEKYVPSASDPTADVKDGSFTLKLPKSGNWTFFAGGFVDQPDATYQNYLIGGMSDLITVTGQGISNITITASPIINGRGFGSVSLSFTDASGKLSKVYVKGTSPLNDKEAVFVDGSATITCNSVPTSSYSVKLLFNDESGNTLYSCKEVINVLQDCTTDTWSGNSSYLKGGVFTITSDMITNYGTDIVPETKVVLFDPTYDATSYSYGYDYSIEGETIFGQGYEPIFCFDKDGYVYVLKEKSDYQSFYVSIWTNNDNVPDNTITIEDVVFDAITIDYSTNTLYGITSDCDCTNLILYAYPKLISENTTEGMKKYVICNISQDWNPSVLSIYNDELFVPYYWSNEDQEIASYKIKMTNISSLKNDCIKDNNSPIETYTLNLSGTEPSELSIQNISLSDSMILTDCIYQDGAVYMLLRESSTSWDVNDAIYSRGAVIKYNCFDGSVKTLGWSNDEIKNTDITKMLVLDQNGHVVSTGNERDEYDLNNSLDLLIGDSDDHLGTNDMIKTWSDLFPSIYAPTTDSSNDCFYGPIKFVGLKPKKLVIADNGVAFYTEEDSLTFKNVNRVVTIDLESFSWSIDETTATFERDIGMLRTSQGFDLGAYYTDSLYTDSNCCYPCFVIKEKE